MISAEHRNPAKLGNRRQFGVFAWQLGKDDISKNLSYGNLRFRGSLDLVVLDHIPLTGRGGHRVFTFLTLARYNYTHYYRITLQSRGQAPNRND
jgi:hypothetical protein